MILHSWYNQIKIFKTTSLNEYFNIHKILYLITCPWSFMENIIMWYQTRYIIFMILLTTIIMISYAIKMIKFISKIFVYYLSHILIRLIYYVKFTQSTLNVNNVSWLFWICTLMQVLLYFVRVANNEMIFEITNRFSITVWKILHCW